MLTAVFLVLLAAVNFYAYAVSGSWPSLAAGVVCLLVAPLAKPGVP